MLLCGTVVRRPWPSDGKVLCSLTPWPVAVAGPLLAPTAGQVSAGSWEGVDPGRESPGAAGCTQKVPHAQRGAGGSPSKPQVLHLRNGAWHRRARDREPQHHCLHVPLGWGKWEALATRDRVR